MKTKHGRAFFWGELVILAGLFAWSYAMKAREPAEQTSFDIIIRNGHILDGAGGPWYAADIGIRADHIAAIGNLADARAKQVVDAEGDIVSPGFIDMLGQSE